MKTYVHLFHSKQNFVTGLRSGYKGWLTSCYKVNGTSLSWRIKESRLCILVSVQNIVNEYSTEYSIGNKTVPEKVATTRTEDGHK
jgi:hypothetical protein